MSFKPPKVPPVIPPPNPATMADTSIATAAQQARTAASGGLQTTLATTPLGDLGSVSTTGKKLTGQ